MFYVELDRKLLQGRHCVSGENLLKRPFEIERWEEYSRKAATKRKLTTNIRGFVPRDRLKAGLWLEH